MRTWLVALLGAAALTAPLASQQAAQQPPVFRSSVDVVQVDVSVLDADGRPVRGLTASDFTLLENNKPQEIVAFAAIDVPTAPAQPAAWLRNVAPDVRSNKLGDGRLFAVLMDDASMPPDLRMAENARAIGRSVIRRLGPDDLAAVIFVSDSRRSVDFTNDRTRLLKAVEGFMPGFAYTDQVTSTDNYQFFSSIRTLGLVAGHLTRVPQRRKAIIYVSTGAPVEASSVANVEKIGFRGTPVLDQLVAGGTLDETTSRDLVAAVSEIVEERPQEAYGTAMRDAFVRAQNGNVNIYSIDPAGVGGMEAFLQQRVRSAKLAGPLMTPVQAITQARMHRDFLQTVAEGSGGRAILSTNDLEKGLGRIFDENSAYYLLGYQSSRDPADRTVRRVGVRVNRANATARTRNAYWSTRPPAAAGPSAAELTGSLAGILPSPDVALQATAAAFRLPDGRAALALATGLEQSVVGDAGARVQEQLNVLATAFSPDGRARGSSQQTARVVLRAGVTDVVAYEVLSRIDLDPGRYQIRVAAHSAMTGKTGSVYFDVDVPDFNREPVMLSGLVLSVTPPQPAAPADAAGAFLPVVPSSQRSFARTDSALGFVRVYQAQGRPPELVRFTVAVTDGSDKIVERSSSTLGPERFETRSADVSFNLPLASLGPGEYLLTVDAARGNRFVRRLLRFTVR